MKKLHKFLICIMALLLSVAGLIFTACGGNSNIIISGPVDVGEEKGQEITLDKKNTVIMKKGTVQLTPTLAEGVEGDVVWYSFNEEIATVSDTGLVTGVSEGKTSIIAVIGEYSASCDVVVIVEEIVADTLTINFNQEKLVLDADLDQEYQLLAEVYFNGNLVDADIEWTTDSPDAISVSNGLVKALDNLPGKHIVSAKVNYQGATQTTNIEVYTETFSRIVLDKDLITLYPGDSGAKIGFDLYVAEVLQLDKSKVTYSSSNVKVATVSQEGVVSPVASGVATVTINYGSISVDVTIVVGEVVNVSTAEGFMAIDGASSTTKFVLANDIDLGNYIFNNMNVNYQYLIEKFNGTLDGNGHKITGIQRLSNHLDKGFKGIFNTINSTAVFEDVRIEAKIDTKFAGTLFADEFMGKIIDSEFYLLNNTESGDALGVSLFRNAIGIVDNSIFKVETGSAPFTCLATKGVNKFNDVIVLGNKPVYGAFLNGINSSINTLFTNCYYVADDLSTAYELAGNGVATTSTTKAVSFDATTVLPQIETGAYDNAKVSENVTIVKPTMSSQAEYAFRIVDAYGDDVTNSMVNGDVFTAQYDGTFTILSKATVNGITTIVAEYIIIEKTPIVLEAPADDHRSVALQTGDEFQIVIKGLGAENFDFYTTDSKIATVDANGKVVAKGLGTALIKVISKTANEYTSVIINVVHMPAELYEVGKHQFVVEVGKQVDLAKEGYNFTNYEPTFNFGQSLIDLSAEGLLTAKSTGNVEMILKNKSNHYDTFTIRIQIVSKYVEIGTLEELKLIDGVEGAYFVLTDDIEIEMSATVVTGQHYTPEDIVPGDQLTRADIEAGKVGDFGQFYKTAKDENGEYHPLPLPEGQTFTPGWEGEKDTSVDQAQVKVKYVNMVPYWEYPTVYQTARQEAFIAKLSSTLDAQGHKITIKATSDTSFVLAGFVSTVSAKTGCIKNLVLDYEAHYKTATTTTNSVSALCQYLDGEIYDCFVSARFYPQGPNVDIECGVGSMTNYEDAVFDSNCYNSIFDIAVYDVAGNLTDDGYAIKVGQRRPKANNTILIKNSTETTFFGQPPSGTGSAIECFGAYIYRTLYDFVNGINGYSYSAQQISTPLSNGATVYANWNDRWSISKDSISLCGRVVEEIEYVDYDASKAIGLTISDGKILCEEEGVYEVYINDKLVATNVTSQFAVADYILTKFGAVTEDYIVVVKSDKVSEAIIFPVTALTQDNFADVMYEATQAKDTTLFVMTEDITVSDDDIRDVGTGGQIQYGTAYMFDTWYGTLDGQGYKLTLDYTNVDTSPATAWYTTGLFRSVQGTVENLQFIYNRKEYKVFSNQETYGTFAAVLQGNGLIKNCYFDINIDFNGKKGTAFPSVIWFYQVRDGMKNCIVDMSATEGGVLSGDTYVLGTRMNYTCAIMNTIWLKKVFGPIEQKFGRTETFEVSGDNIITYTKRASIDDETNFLDSSKVWKVDLGIVTLCGKTVLNTLEEEKFGTGAKMTDGILTWILPNEYTIKIDGTIVKTTTTADLSFDVIGYLTENNLLSSKTYTIEMGEDKFDFEIKTLTNENFIATMRQATINGTNAYYIMAEDITINDGVYGSKDGTLFANRNEWNAASADQKFDDPSVKTASGSFCAFGDFYGTLNGNGYKLTFDNSSITHFPATAWASKLTSLFRSIYGRVENLNYEFKMTRSAAGVSGVSVIGFVTTLQAGGAVDNCYLNMSIDSNGLAEPSNSCVIGAVAGKLTNTVIRVKSESAGVQNNNSVAVDTLLATGTLENVILISQNTDEITQNFLGKGEPTPNGVIVYADFGATESANNWLDSNESWAITATELKLLGKAVLTK